MADRSASPPIIPVSLTDYPRTESVYQGVDDDRNLLFRQFLYDGWQTTERKPLESPALVALGLTEVCSRVGFGKVFYFPLPFVAQKWVERTAAKDAAARIIWAIKRMPELIYVPYVWHPKDVANWKDITHAERCHLLHGRAGGVMGRDIVMPLDFKYDAVERKSFRMNEYVEEAAGHKAMLMIVPKAYVGWYREVRPLASYKFMLSPATLEPCQVGNAEELIHKLWQMYRSSEPRSLVRFRDLLEQVTEFQRLVDEAKGARHGREHQD